MRHLFIAVTATALAACGGADSTATTTTTTGANDMLVAADAERAAKPIEAPWQDYTGAAFNQAQADGKTIIVDVYADWCPTCKAQAPILDEIAADDRLADAAFFKVDYDRDKDFVKAFRVPRQSTVLKFEGGEETERVVADTDRDRLRGTFLGTAV